MIETPAEVLRLAEIAPAPALAGLVLGTNDLAKELLVKPTSKRRPFQPLFTMAVAAARTHGLSVLDGVFNDIHDDAGFAAECAQAADFGSDGKTLIHPRQIAAANQAFSPGDTEIAWARVVIEAFGRAENADKGAIQVQGKMVERLHLEQALHIVASLS
jgi:citrate lyase subunit beta/citryl-CoA lyase